ncbi:hypothetical protein GGR56DRAFT_258343 [Xylariaceae sp. FL0804]|nr:hypothetical protein GGR56DRAFT_258343 [Xylariaceae sp. FL0804]
MQLGGVRLHAAIWPYRSDARAETTPDALMGRPRTTPCGRHPVLPAEMVSLITVTHTIRYLRAATSADLLQAEQQDECTATSRRGMALGQATQPRVPRARKPPSNVAGLLVTAKVRLDELHRRLCKPAAGWSWRLHRVHPSRTCCVRIRHGSERLLLVDATRGSFPLPTIQGPQEQKPPSGASLAGRRAIACLHGSIGARMVRSAAVEWPGQTASCRDISIPHQAFDDDDPGTTQGALSPLPSLHLAAPPVVVELDAG